MSSSNNSIMVSDTGENDLRAQPTVLTANNSTLPPPSFGATTTSTITAESSLPFFSSSLSLSAASHFSSSSPSLSLTLPSILSPSSSSSESHLTAATNILPPQLSSADLAATITIINHLLHNLNLDPKDIATLLTTSPPLSAAPPPPADGGAAIMAGPSLSMHQPTLPPSSPFSAHQIWPHPSPTSSSSMAASLLAETHMNPHHILALPNMAVTPIPNPNPTLITNLSLNTCSRHTSLTP